MTKPGGVTQHRRSSLEERTGRRPAEFDAPGEEFIRGGFHIPDGDRRQFSKSTHSKDEPSRIRQGEAEIVTVLILLDQIDPRQGDSSTWCPFQDGFEVA
jgi:hypothetical protein